MADRGTDNDQRCRILELPPELRLRIYGYVWEPVSHYVLVDCYDASDVQHSRLLSLIGARLSVFHRTCRAIYREASPFLYDSVIYHIDLVFNFAMGGSTDKEAVRLLRLVLEALNTRERRQGPKLVGVELDVHLETKKEDLAMVLKMLAAEKFRGHPYVTLSPDRRLPAGITLKATTVKKEMEVWFGGLAEGAHWLLGGRGVYEPRPGL
ncbi:hypothetical protein LTS10_000555 [Elasticomyces elasticus]|nr:hypothetical protein LTS10_000555 [Elasticomyces elasticus]